MYLRDVVEEPRFSEDFDTLRQQYPTIDELHAEFTWLLAVKPTTGNPLPFAPDFRLLTTEPTFDLPAFWILYTFDAERVYLHSIELVRDGE